MKPYITITVLFTLFFSALLTGCAKDNMEEAPAIPYQKIAEGYATGAATRVELYAAGSLTTGFNALYLALYDSVSKQRLQNARVTLSPLMDMGTMKHAAPVENPLSVKAVENFFPAAVVFTMPSARGSWTLGIRVETEGRQGLLTLPLTIAEPAVSRVKSFVSKADNAKFVVACLQPTAPKVGVNDMEIAIYKVKNMMEFPADSSLAVTLIPEMPTMGHGSPNNTDPVHTTRGHYKGKVNFTMTGLWHLNLDFHAGGAVADTTTYFEVNF